MGIQKGIELHRSIDTFTDNHHATAKAKTFLRQQYRLYAGAFVDVIYDHFLATDEKQFEVYSNLENFSLITYTSLENYFEIMPVQFQNIFPHMKSHNWLCNYRLREGIKKSFGGLAWRAVYLNESDIAFDIFNKYYDEFKECYNEFFPEVKKYADDYLRNLLAN